MAWTEITRRQYRREGQRYASDLTDGEWALIAPHLPPPRRLGRPRTTDLRDVVDALLYMAATGRQWRMLPKDFPPYSTARRKRQERCVWMARKMTEWPSKRGPITKSMPSDGCKGDTVPLAVPKWYDFHELGWHLGNVGSIERKGFTT